MSKSKSPANPHVKLCAESGFCCHQLAAALLVEPYLDPEHNNLFVLDGQLCIRLYDDQSVRFDEAADYCPWCGEEFRRPKKSVRSVKVDTVL